MLRGALLVVLLLVSSSTALAQGSSRDLAAARELFRAGVTAGTEDRWPEALDAFQRAYELSGRADVLLNVAAAQVELHQFLAAGDTYRRFQAEAEPAMLEQHGDAVVAALADLSARTPHLRVVLVGIEASDVADLDGEVLAPAALGVDLPVDPGHHVVTLRRGPETLEVRSIEITEGARVELSLVAPARVAVPVDDEETVVVPVITPTTAGSTETTRPDPTPWIVLGVVGGVLVVAGVTVGIYFATTPNEAPGFVGTIPPGTVDVR